MSEPLLYSTRVMDPFIKLIQKRYPQVDLNDILAYAQIMPWEMADYSHWLTQGQVNRFYERAVELTGNPALAREAGQYGASPEVFGTIRTYVLSFMTPQAVFNRIGDVISRLTHSSTYTSRQLSLNTAEITVVPNSGVQEELFQCENRVGVFEALLSGFHYRTKTIKHPECLFKGSDCCRYIISWQPTRAAYFRRSQHVVIIIAPFILAGAYVLQPSFTMVAAVSLIALLSVFYALEIQSRLKESEAGVELLESARDQLAELLDTTYNHTQLTSEIGQVISSQTTIDTVLEAVVKVLQKRLDFDRGMVLMANESRTLLVYRAGFGHTEKEKELLLNAAFRLDNPESQGVFTKAFHEQVPYLVDDFVEFEKRHTQQSIRFAKAIGTKAFVCCPIICDGESIGVLAVDNLRSDRNQLPVSEG